jgi:hypothetical protein
MTQALQLHPQAAAPRITLTDDERRWWARRHPRSHWSASAWVPGLEHARERGAALECAGPLSSAFLRWGVGNPPAVPLLDGLATPAAAWAVGRRLLTSYTGALIRVRRTSDDAEQDIGYTATGVLDTAALSAFCAGANGLVKTQYDQVGTYNNTQAAVSRQPKIYDSVGGVQLGADGYPTAVYDGAPYPNDDGYVHTGAGDSVGLSGTTALSLYWHGRCDAYTSGSEAHAGLGRWSGGDCFWLYPSSFAPLLMHVSICGASRTFNCAYVGVDSAYVATLGAGAGIGTAVLRQNGLALTEQSSVNPSDVLGLDPNNRHVGTDSYGEKMQGQIQTVIWWGSVLSAGDIAALEAGRP